MSKAKVLKTLLDAYYFQEGRRANERITKKAKKMIKQFENDHLEEKSKNIMHTQDDKSALVFIRSNDDECVHVLWEMPNGTLMCFEHVPDNYPSTHYMTYKTEGEYINSISGVGWILGGFKGEDANRINRHTYPEIYKLYTKQNE